LSPAPRPSRPPGSAIRTAPGGHLWLRQACRSRYAPVAPAGPERRRCVPVQRQQHRGRRQDHREHMQLNADTPRAHGGPGSHRRAPPKRSTAVLKRPVHPRRGRSPTAAPARPRTRGRRNGVQMPATAKRHASYEVMTATHIRACSPRRDSSWHTPHEGLGGRSGRLNARSRSRALGGCAIPPMPSICGAADHTTPPSAYHNAVSPSRSCTPRGGSPRHRSGPPLSRLTNHYRDHLAGRRPGDEAAHGAHSAARIDLERVTDLFRSFRQQSTPEFVRPIAGLRICRQGNPSLHLPCSRSRCCRSPLRNHLAAPRRREDKATGAERCLPPCAHGRAVGCGRGIGQPRSVSAGGRAASGPSGQPAGAGPPSFATSRPVTPGRSGP
jgi:hypothetical protein